MDSNEPLESLADDSDRDSSLFEVRKEREQRRERHKRQRRRVAVIRTLLLMLVALAAGIAVGLFVLPSVLRPASTGGSTTTTSAPALFAPAVAGRVSVEESELDQPLGSYTCQGVTTSVSVREAIEESTSLDAVRNSDGTYDVPSADSVLAIARNRLLLQEAQNRGIAATDEDAIAYAREVWQTDDLGVIAASYSMTPDQTKKLITESATIKKLRDEVVHASAAAPAAPKAPEAGREDEPMQEYADYIMGLLGDEWNAADNTWAREDGPYYDKLKNFTISSDGATFSAAQEAYFVAQTISSAESQQVSTEWSAFVNAILSGVTVELNSLVA